ncbi:TraR/DksA family transcriptional regulator [Teredinibacter sp. KSP-S5-2]|uniref:TraR/DksA family transcriptional regulator n=1 Tax=Teredinibacter sp. KSP-S5-2 TaxID=3034506 RepID=UPI00293439FE|nr:TraR/DksA family transcriptional regulator [Teredinibacter sp. KSP-S5-2]WNO08779.1 TraR/DksA family transcriptional regulator [Teredinibacter sp. KSP-S5-2]
MNRNTRKQALIALLDQYQETADTQEEAAQTVELDQSKVGRLSRMDALQSQAMSQEQQRRAMLQIKELKRALVKIDTGDYGYCEACEEPIAEARLEVNPTARYCIKCAELQENQ